MHLVEVLRGFDQPRKAKVYRYDKVLRMPNEQMRIGEISNNDVGLYCISCGYTVKVRLQVKNCNRCR